MLIELICASRPLGSFLDDEISFIIASSMVSVHFDQASTTLLYFSPCVMRPSLYCCSNSFASSRVFSTVVHFERGPTMSSLPKVMPALTALGMPRPRMRSEGDCYLLLPHHGPR